MDQGGTRPLLELLLLIVVRVVRASPLRRLAVVTMALIMAAHLAGELRSIGVTDIWFPFGIGVTLAQYTYAMATPILAWLLVRTSPSPAMAMGPTSFRT